MVRRPENEWTTTPKGIMQFARFMQETGALQAAPEDWRDVFFPTMREAGGGCRCCRSPSPSCCCRRSGLGL